MYEKVGASGKNDEEMENFDVENFWWKIFALKYLPLIFASNSPCKSYENEQNPYFTNVQKANITDLVIF